MVTEKGQLVFSETESSLNSSPFRVIKFCPLIPCNALQRFGKLKTNFSTGCMVNVCLLNTRFTSLRAVTTVQEVMALVYYGMQRRHEDATMVHAHSSRSHLIVQLTIYTISNAKPNTSSSDAAPSPPGTPTRSRRTLPQPSAGHSSRSQSPAPKSKAAAARRSR